ncbi:MAG TPA: hypothetical protein VNT79_04755 [Phycisphaerae bacterium]|nr:hypothetical protein [Phycisphaerae bacterium]
MTPGRFIVRLAGARHENLTYDQLIELVDGNPGEISEILRVHRVHGDGTMDLVGVSPNALRARDGLLLLWHDIASARRDYDALIALANRAPPPVRIELQLAHTKDDAAPHVVALTFPLACGEGVGQWLIAAGFKTRAPIDASPSHLRQFEDAVSQIILSATLAPEQAAE